MPRRYMSTHLDGVGRGQDAGAGVEGVDDARLRDGDRLLLHHLRNTKFTAKRSLKAVKLGATSRADADAFRGNLSWLTLRLVEAPPV